MGKQTEDWYREQAKRLYEKPRKDMGKPAAEVRGYADVEVGTGPATPGVRREEKPVVSMGTNPGAWVMLWVWIPDPPEVTDGKEDAGSTGEGAAGGSDRQDG